MATVQSIVLRERSLKDVNPALGSKHSDLHHHFAVVHLSDGKSHTVEYGHFENETNGTIRIKDGSETIHAMIEAHEFDTEHGLPWKTVEHWILKESGFQNTPWTPQHQSDTFNQALLAYLLAHTKRPASALGSAKVEKLNVKPADADGIAVFDKVKHDVIHKVHELHQKDAVHHTHLLDKASHISAYKLISYAIKPVDYGFIYFGKINIGPSQFLHARAHKYHDASKPVTFHSIRITRDTGIWSDKAELVYFDE